MIKEDSSRRIKRLLIQARLVEDLYGHLVSSESFRSEVTRALEPTYSNYKRQELLNKIQEAQKELNRQKNILTKISKILRSLS
jgi:hypothetical protein